MDRTYGAGAQPGSWDAQITGARDAWNNAPVLPDFYEFPTFNETHDVHVEVDNYGATGWAGYAPLQGNPVVKATVQLNVYYTGPYQRLVAHELGHVLLLDHDGLNDPPPVGVCGPPRAPGTIMDYDCLPTTPNPVNWDFCGVNHKWYSATWGWSGC